MRKGRDGWGRADAAAPFLHLQGGNLLLVGLLAVPGQCHGPVQQRDEVGSILLLAWRNPVSGPCSGTEFLFGPQQGSVSPSEASREENGHFWLLGHSAWQPLSPLISHVKGASALTPREVGFPWNSVTLEQCGKRKMNAGL